MIARRAAHHARATHAGHDQICLARAAGRQSLDLEFARLNLGGEFGSGQRSGEGVQCHGSGVGWT